MRHYQKTLLVCLIYDLIMTGATVEADGVVLLKDGVLNKETILA